MFKRDPLLRILSLVYKPFEFILENHKLTYTIFLKVLNLQQDKMSSGDWMCGACQHVNFKKRDACQRCQCPKFATPAEMSTYGIDRTEVLAGDWYCSTFNCGSHNYASRTVCYRCGTLKDYTTAAMIAASTAGYYTHDSSALPGWKSGDWVCNRLGCGVHNYASRMECYKCKTPRE
ncbi:hypothetical protein L2E82_11924 [Cichorium intybus]|uniref:Uncharacterized protein n=1 Tax=Cichorium intybus TaxID=13427 RepID=A0ACB9GFA9_CICIN|nr:hypothetical protein L2E82_11924 [Cichorium intybus]